MLEKKNLSHRFSCVCVSHTGIQSLYTSVQPPPHDPITIPWRSAAGVVCHLCAWAEAEVCYVAEGGVGESGDWRLVVLSHLVAWVDDGLPQTGDPLLLAEGVIGLQAVWVNFGAPPAAHTETVPHWEERGHNGGEEGHWVDCCICQFLNLSQNLSIWIARALYVTAELQETVRNRVI